MFRGFLFERLSKLLGEARAACAAIVVLSSVAFALALLPEQGLPGVEQAFVVGLLLGVVCARTRSIWFAMSAHVIFDLAALAIIYGRLEAGVARFIFG